MLSKLTLSFSEFSCLNLSKISISFIVCRVYKPLYLWIWTSNMNKISLGIVINRSKDSRLVRFKAVNGNAQFENNKIDQILTVVKYSSGLLSPSNSSPIAVITTLIDRVENIFIKTKITCNIIMPASIRFRLFIRGDGRCNLI